jgi:hypothetical protein
MRVVATKAGLLHSFLAVVAKLVVDANVSKGAAGRRLVAAAKNQAAHLRDNIRTCRQRAGGTIGKIGELSL